MTIHIRPLTKYEERWEAWRDEMVLLNEQNTRLLAVARAAGPVLWTNNDEKMQESSAHKRLRAALAAVEDLL